MELAGELELEPTAWCAGGLSSLAVWGAGSLIGVSQSGRSGFAPSRQAVSEVGGDLWFESGNGCVGSGGCCMELNSCDCECSINRTGFDVDELHAAVGNDDETSKQDSAGHQKVIASFAVGIRAHPSADEPPPPQQAHQCSDSNHDGNPSDYPQQREDS